MIKGKVSDQAGTGLSAVALDEATLGKSITLESTLRLLASGPYNIDQILKMDAKMTNSETNDTTIALLVSFEGMMGLNTIVFLKVNLAGKFTWATPETTLQRVSYPAKHELKVVKILDDILVLGCPSCNNGNGSIKLYNFSNQVHFSYEYVGNGYQVGNYVLCSIDSLD